MPDYVGRLDDGIAGMRFAWSPDFGFVDPIDRRVVDTIAAAVPTFEEAGGIVEAPALRIEDIWDALRRFPVIDVEQSYEEFEHAATVGPPDSHATSSCRSRPIRRCARRSRSTCSIGANIRASSTYTMSIPPWIRNMPVDTLESVFERYDLLLSPVIIAHRTAVRGALARSVDVHLVHVHRERVGVLCGVGAVRVRRRHAGGHADHGPARRRAHRAPGRTAPSSSTGRGRSRPRRTRHPDQASGSGELRRPAAVDGDDGPTDERRGPRRGTPRLPRPLAVHRRGRATPS